MHDLRASMVTIGLANGRSEEWVRRRTGHTSSALERYRREDDAVAGAVLRRFMKKPGGRPMKGISEPQYRLLVRSAQSCTGDGDGFFTSADEANLSELEKRELVRWCECGCDALHPEVTALGRDARYIHEWLRSEAET